MKRYVRWAIAGVALLALGALLSWAYSYISPMTPRASEEWSRGRVVGRTPVSRPAALWPAPSGGMLLVWPNMDDRLELAHIGVDGEVLLDRDLPVEAEVARDPQVRVGPDGRMHVLWREDGGDTPVVQYAMFEEDGTLLGGPQVLSDPAHEVEGAPRLVLDADGRLHALWADDVGIYWTMIGPEGALLAEPTLLVPQGRCPAAQVDADGVLHLAWQERLGVNSYGVYYAALDPDSGEMGEAEEMGTAFLRTGQRIEVVAVGLDPEVGYVLWTVQDLREASSRGRYAYFPLGLPRQKRTAPLRLEQGRYPLGIYPLDGQRSPLLVALSEMVPTAEGDVEAQIGVVAVVRDQTPEYEVWGLSRAEGGQGRLCAPSGRADPAGSPPGQGPLARGWEMEHIVTASNRPSLKPVLAVDDRLYMHLAWLETGGFGQYRVVYASTAPEVRQRYNALTLWDGVNAVLGGLLRLSAVVWAVLPMALLWAFLPLMVLLVYHLVTGEEDLDTPRSRTILGVVLVCEVGLSFLLPPGVTLGWPALRWAIPAAAALLAGAVTMRALRRERESALFTSFFLFTAALSLLQLMAYLLFGEGF